MNVYIKCIAITAIASYLPVASTGFDFEIGMLIPSTVAFMMFLPMAVVIAWDLHDVQR